jgi:hypothetical protein
MSVENRNNDIVTDGIETVKRVLGESETGHRALHDDMQALFEAVEGL